MPLSQPDRVMFSVLGRAPGKQPLTEVCVFRRFTGKCSEDSSLEGWKQDCAEGKLDSACAKAASTGHLCSLKRLVTK